MKQRMKFYLNWLKVIMSLSLVALFAAGCSDDDDDPVVITQDPTLTEAATSAGLTTLLDAVTAADLGATLENSAAITVFAPTNEAFGAALTAFGVDNLDDLVTELGGVDNLETVLGFHVVPAVAFAADLAEGDQMLTTLADQMITVNRTGNNVTVTDATGTTYQVTTADVAIANGVVHVINGVLLPSIEYPNVVDAAESADLTTLISAITAVDGLATTLTDAEAITVFAPTNDAFGTLLTQYGAADLNALVAKLGGIEVLTSVLQYHVVPSVAFSHDLTNGMMLETLQGSMLEVGITDDGATLTDVDGITYNISATDVVIDNGVVHVIDGVVLPIDRSNVVEAAESANLDLLLASINAVDGLGTTLLDAEAITVFAPTDAAFNDILTRFNVDNLDELVTALGGVENLATVLEYHVVPSVAYAGDLAEGNQMLPTLAGEMLTVNRNGDTVTIADSEGSMYTVSTPDVTIENGVVHVISGVLVPTLD